MADQEQKAIEFIQQAEKKLKSSSGFLGSLLGGSSKTEDAAELFVKAANSFKIAKKWGESGNAFCRAADIHLKLGNRHEAGTQFADAANCFKKTDKNEAANCLLKAIEIYIDMGRFTIAAKNHMDIAELYEGDQVDVEKVMSNYQKAADFYQGEESNSSANKCLLKVALYAAQIEQYEKAAEIYEKVASSCIDNQLLRHSAKEHFFRAALCRMCQDMQDGTNAISKYEDMFPAFSDSRECKLLKL